MFLVDSCVVFIHLILTKMPSPAITVIEHDPLELPFYAHIELPFAEYRRQCLPKACTKFLVICAPLAVPMLILLLVLLPLPVPLLLHTTRRNEQRGRIGRMMHKLIEQVSGSAIKRWGDYL